MVRISDIIRAEFAEGDNKRDAGLETPENIIRYNDIAYGTESKWQKLDVYRPKEAAGKLPVIVSVHGGGWVYGDKERYQFYCMDLAERLCGGEFFLSPGTGIQVSGITGRHQFCIYLGDGKCRNL